MLRQGVVVRDFLIYWRTSMHIKDGSEQLMRGQSMWSVLVECWDDPRPKQRSNTQDVRPSQMKKNEQDVVKTLHAVQNFVDPFAMDDTEHLYNITSGTPAPPYIETDVLRAEAAGAKAKKTLLKNAWKTNHSLTQWSGYIWKHSVTWTSLQNWKRPETKVSNINSRVTLHFSYWSSHKISSPHLTWKSLWPIHSHLCHTCIGTSDDFLAKTDKSKGFHFSQQMLQMLWSLQTMILFW